MFLSSHPLATGIFLIASTVAQTISPSNSSQDLYPASTSPRFLLNGTEFTDMPAIRLAPLGQYAEMSHSDFTQTDVTGRLVRVDASNANSNFDEPPRNFFYLSCDPDDYEGNLNANNVFTIAASNSDAFLIILFSRISNHCTATGIHSLPQLATLLTTTEPMVASMLSASTPTSTNSSTATATLLPDLNAYTNATSDNHNGGWGSRGPNGSPTTAVAMIILYSITGVITALFVTIIITGAIRAHRHPERYGPRVGAGLGGRGRQSRARGVARAMLDTLPIVKFGDRDGDGGTAGAAQKSGSVAAGSEADATNGDRGRDIEMTAEMPNSNGSNASGTDTSTGALTQATAVGAEAAATAGKSSSPATEPFTTSPPDQDAPKPTDGPTPIAGASEENAPSCSICTEDFVVGSDVRVLPCNHRFHPECVDPWLLNVSGTCPLCRIDLRPKENGAGEGGLGGTGEEGDATGNSGDGATTASGTLPADDRHFHYGVSTTAGFRPGEDHLMAFSLRSGRSRGARRHSAVGVGAGVGAEGAGEGALAGLRRALAGSREERVMALRRFREQRRQERQGEAGTSTGAAEEVEESRGLARRLRERLRVRTERRADAAQARPQDDGLTLGQIRSREHVSGRPV